jgi:cell cycle sensor histidine kinase DivJ
MRVFGRESVCGLATYIESLVHDSARADVLKVARHQSFIGSRLVRGLLALCVFPIYLGIAGKPSVYGAVAFLWLLTPIAIAVFLSRTGRLGAAHLISAANFASLVTYCAWLTGGLLSPLLPWLVVVPLEAGLASDRRIVVWTVAVAWLGLAILAGLSLTGMMPVPLTLPISQGAFFLLGAASATAYAAGLAVMSQIIHTRSDKAIRAGEERYRMLAENVNDMITRHDQKGRVVFASPASQQLLGEPVQRVLGDGLFDHVHVADRPAYLTALSRCQTQNEAIAVEFRIKRGGAAETARYAWVEMRCRPVPQREGSDRPGVVAVTRDISDHKAQEAALLGARDEAEGSSRAKTQFLASMSHELRTPLNAIIGFSEILKRELFGQLGEVRYRDYARLIHESGEHLLNVVNEILDMSKIEAGSFTIVKEPFDVAALVTSVCELMRHTAEQKSLMLKVHVTPNIPELTADKRACKQMLLNVISNAIKFTKENGWVQVSAFVDGDNLVFAVSDNGIGIADQDLPRLGTPFVQASSSYDLSHEGAGLGLSVVKGLARLHGGSLELSSTLGSGTLVRMVLPLECSVETIQTSVEAPTVSAA